MNEDMNKKKRLYNIAIAAVSVLLAITLTLLVVVLCGSSVAHSVSPNNKVEAPLSPVVATLSVRSDPGMMLLASTSQEKLTLSWWTGYDGDKTFSVSNTRPRWVRLGEYSAVSIG